MRGREKLNEWPRVHTCLRGWCKAHRPECDRCDAVIQIMRPRQHDQHMAEYWHAKRMAMCHAAARREITAEHFKLVTGVEPEQDDLDRCNCPKAGQHFHYCCGWDWERDRPNFWPKQPEPRP